MPSPALARLESLLGAHKLDHTLTSRLPPVPEEGPAGLPRGQISEIVGSRSSGRQTVLVSRLAAATGRGELVALVDPLDMFDPVSAAAHGVELPRMLWVRGCAGGPDRVSLPREAGEAGVQVERAVKALNLILQASGFGLVALDLGEIPLPVLGRVPFTTWRRLHRVIEGGETACVVVAAVPVARSVGGITVALSPPTPPQAERATPRGEGLPASGGGAGLKASRLFPKLTIDGRVIGSRGLGIRDSGLGIGDSRLAIRDSLTATDH
jgi:RecA DNA recombination protein